MIDLYTAATPNGYKVSIALGALGLPYEASQIAERSAVQGGWRIPGHAKGGSVIKTAQGMVTR